MHAGKACLSSVSRRTRSQWDAFYRSRHDEIKKKSDQESGCVGNGGCGMDYDERIQNFETRNESFGEKGIGKNADSMSSEDFENSMSSGDLEDSERSSFGEDDADGSDRDYKVKICKYVQKKGAPKVARTIRKKGFRAEEPVDLINKLVDSIWKENDLVKDKPASVKRNAQSNTTLPLKFRLMDDQESCLAEKTDWEMEIDSLFSDLEIGLWESEIGCTNSSMKDDESTVSTDNDENPVARCGRGEHDLVLDEQTGIICKRCCAVLLEIKYVLPPFYVESPEKRERKTIPHQLDGFEFLWRNIAGDILIKKLEKLPANGGRGCIISHAPGTGKTRLTIVFLQTFMKLYPACRPVIIAPRGMLLTWEQELKKWNVDIRFHNLNETKLSSEETAIAAGIIGQTGNQEKNKDYNRCIKLYSWMKGGSILGVGYRLFEELAGENEKKHCNDKFKKILLELPGLLVLDEGHTPRNNQSLMWKALTKTTTQRRIILSGTPFQNNFSELYNTLCLVNPRFSHQIMSETSCGRNFTKTAGRKRKVNAARDEWANLTSSISKTNSGADGLKKLRSMIEPFVHIHKGSILQNTLPGMRDCLVILRPTDLQRELLQNVARVEKFLEQAYLASLISVHPSLAADKPEFSDHKRKLKSLASDPNAGVKTQFLIKLIQLSIRLHEKVLVFSEFIDPLLHIKNLLKSHFSWNDGREIIYMDGDQGIKQRQHLINSFNDKHGEAKVLLASQRACSEGINLVGASRVVLLDVVWNPSVERQAICRAYRLGQEKMVYVYHVMTLMEVKKYARQAEKERISELIFSSPDGGGAGGGGRRSGCDEVVSEDKVLEAMVGHQSFGSVFERIVHQPKESDLVNTFGFVDLKQ
ncbi:SNF2 domain-containing protein CLASSY 3 [Sesamum angolense]|uniref:SNF2 domain-containing protein CLASSY 3 n=1 Tax=Sesamum angolense TaxID=2727404 RepID=A0AAE2BPH6_9LAMI|nr:SNF2 domain-containing protein CLASSY 3 [Sesamum angolense]